MGMMHNRSYVDGFNNLYHLALPVQKEEGSRFSNSLCELGRHITIMDNPRKDNSMAFAQAVEA
ncbi:hypothetical protein N7491_000070 [Penicillium cf. griseofulvum]|uniref:Uncharacterized protein n=1 Tax=Penicillium cf. griseofulvum TaxID=2972120 RepID=A0A9W9MEU2_9EURO|nr:hypothetical protein N7472_004577 [Penicillium cf. griseofulvum]KAJ5442139.1 hypothetical protein N7445_005146 [Penicillium cf. griseofulvum]KAJ5450888.1 hypothetical protein N7491_000070 [Penicillium cf. griseofulvum]